MRPKSGPCIVLGTLFSLIMLIGCASQPRSTYPVLEQIVESDVDLDCAGFDDELLKANAIRDEILDEHGDVVQAAAMGAAFDIAMDPISGILLGAIQGISTANASKTYLEAATAAGLRMEQMLNYKEAGHCPSGPTGDPGLTDSTALARLHDLEAQLRQEAITQAEYLSERRMVLDGVR